EERSVDRAARAAGPNQVPAAVSVVDRVASARLAADGPHGVLLDLRSRALEQPRIELETANRVLHARDLHVQALPVGVQLREREESVRILGRVHLEVAYDLGGNPAGAELETRECLFVEHEDVRACAFQLP